VPSASGGGADAYPAPEYCRQCEAGSDGKIIPLGLELQPGVDAILQDRKWKTLVTLQLGTGKAKMRCTLQKRQQPA